MTAAICTDCTKQAYTDSHGNYWTCDECSVTLCHECYDRSWGCCAKCYPREEEGR